jgi:hypothetical protein
MVCICKTTHVGIDVDWDDRKHANRSDLIITKF